MEVLQLKLIPMDTDQINKAVEGLKTDLKEGLLTCDIWISGTGQPIASYDGGNVKATALFDQITENIKKALEVANFPGIDPYYMFFLENGTLILIILVENLQWGVSIDPSKAQLGLVLNIAIPNAVENLKKAV